MQARQAGGFYAGQARPGYAGQLGPRSHWQKKLQVLPPHDNLDILGRTGFYFSLVCRAGWAVPGRRGRWRASGAVGRATHWASHSLGEPVLGRATHWASTWANPCLGRAIKRGWGEPSNEAIKRAVGRASTKRPLGEPVLRARWASQLGKPVLGEPVGRASTRWALGEPLNFHSQRLLGATVPRHVPARHCACSARLVKCQLGTCPLGTSTC